MEYVLIICLDGGGSVRWFSLPPLKHFQTFIIVSGLFGPQYTVLVVVVGRVNVISIQEEVVKSIGPGEVKRPKV